VSSENGIGAIFLDADGVLWEDIGSGGILSGKDHSIKNLRFLSSNTSKQYLKIVISNQTYAARKKMTYVRFKLFTSRFFNDLIEQGLIKDETPFQKKDRLKTNSILRLIFIGRIVDFKGLHLLLKAIAELDDYKIELDIYGQSNNDKYEIDCKNSCVNNNLVSFKGPILHARVVETIMQYDLLCLCSTFSEMSPLVIQEAFEAKVPVLASNVKGNTEQIQHNINGLLFNFNDINSLKQQLLRCINEPNLLANLKKNIVKPNKFSNVSQAYFQLYKTLLN
jgi:glycosyltransferase involved in cell wall biosynthesis